MRMKAEREEQVNKNYTEATCFYDEKNANFQIVLTKTQQQHTHVRHLETKVDHKTQTDTERRAHFTSGDLGLLPRLQHQILKLCVDVEKTPIVGETLDACWMLELMKTSSG